MVYSIHLFPHSLAMNGDCLYCTHCSQSILYLPLWGCSLLAITTTRIRKQRMLRTFLPHPLFLPSSSSCLYLFPSSSSTFPRKHPKDHPVKSFISVVFNLFLSASLHLQSNVCLPKQGSSQRSILPIRLQEIGVRISFGHSPLPAVSNNLFIVQVLHQRQWPDP